MKSTSDWTIYAAKLEKEVKQLKQKEIDLTAIIKAHVDAGEKQLKEIVELKSRIEAGKRVFDEIKDICSHS